MNNDMTFNWDDEISEDSSFRLLDPGEYDFKVTKFERGYYNGGAKILACNKAIVEITIDGMALTENFFLVKSQEWKMSSFFRSLGMKKHGEPVRMAWNEIMGKTGRAKVKIDTYTGTDGNEHKVNRVENFIDAPTDLPFDFA